MTTVRSKERAYRRYRYATGRALTGSGVFVLLLASGGPVVRAAAEGPGQFNAAPPPTRAQIGAAAGQVDQRQAALGARQKRLGAANAQLIALRTQQEVLTERYDRTLVNEQQALAAYKVTESRLAVAQRARSVSRRRLAAVAAQEYESRGGVGTATAMLGDDNGPQAYLNGAALGQMLAQYGTDTLAEKQADDVVAGVFRTQAHDLLMAQQADLRAANDLKLAIQAEVARQAALVRSDKAATDKAAADLAAAQAREAALQAARQAALAATAAQQAAQAVPPAQAAPGPSWSSSSGASSGLGNAAADWALSQLGKPYLWGGSGPAAYDCSGLTMMAWAHVGVQLLHWTGYQWIEGPHVPLGGLQRGDLVFYATNTSDPATIHHVGIYIGNGMMVDAPYTGAFVRIDPIDDPGLIGAIRPAAFSGG